jgi:TPR repeat protein
MQNAFNSYYSAYTEGDVNALVEIGKMILNGDLSNGDTSVAVEYFTLAARYNNQNAINYLKLLGHNIPYPDAYYYQESLNANASAEAAEKIANSMKESADKISASLKNSSTNPQTTTPN